jgi:hypothetical protein
MKSARENQRELSEKKRCQFVKRAKRVGVCDLVKTLCTFGKGPKVKIEKRQKERKHLNVKIIRSEFVFIHHVIPLAGHW